MMKGNNINIVVDQLKSCTTRRVTLINTTRAWKLKEDFVVHQHDAWKPPHDAFDVKIRFYFSIPLLFYLLLFQKRSQGKFLKNFQNRFQLKFF